MTRDEHLMTIAMEECCEVAQRISKAKRFGTSEVQPGQEQTNRERIWQEFNDLCAVMEMAGLIDIDHEGCIMTDAAMVGEKERKVEHFLKYSAECGTIAAPPAPPAAPLVFELKRQLAETVNLFEPSGAIETPEFHRGYHAAMQNILNFVRSAPPAAAEWQPIATAPEQFGWIFGYGPDCGIATFCWLDGEWVTPAIDRDTKALHLVNEWKPTMWMPLPAPPVAANTQDKS